MGERYARAIINDLNRWTVGWIDWNLLLDSTGGPNHVGNLCSAPLLADPANDSLLVQPSWYYLGHFSRFDQPGARRNPDGTVATVVLNRTEKAVEASLRVGQGPYWRVHIPAHSISTFQ